MNIHLSPPSRDNLGRHGVVARITTDHGGWHGVYRFQTHGMTADEVAAERDRIEAWHSRKAAKLTELDSLILSPLGGGYVITDATVRDRAKGCEVVCRASGGENGPIEYHEVFDDPADVPPAPIVLSTMNLIAITKEDHSAEAIEHLASVRAALGLE